MIELIESVRKDRDSIGGVCELVAAGVPPGLGEPVFDKLKADLAKALLSLPAVTGLRVRRTASQWRGTMRGSENNDAVRCAGSSRRIRATETNRHGGMLGGISSGDADRLPRGDQADELHPAIAANGHAGRRADGNSVKGRHDPCLLPRFVPMGEAMVALVLVDHLLRCRASRLSS